MLMMHSVSQTNKLLFDYAYKGDAMKNNILILTRVLTLVIAALLVGSVWGFTTNQDSDINANLTVTGALKIGSVDKSGDGVVDSVADNAESDTTIPTTKAVKAYVDSVNPFLIVMEKKNFSSVERYKKNDNDVSWTLKINGLDVVTASAVEPGNYFVSYDLGSKYSGWELIAAKDNCVSNTTRLGSSFADSSGKGVVAFNLLVSNQVAFCVWKLNGAVDNDTSHIGKLLLVRERVE